MTELAADGIPVAVTYRVLTFARQPYYRWLTCPVIDPLARVPYSDLYVRVPHGDRLRGTRGGLASSRGCWR